MNAMKMQHCCDFKRIKLFTTENLKENKNKIYSKLILPAVLYGIENWTITARHSRRTTAAGMKYISYKTNWIHEKTDYPG
jgi:hypothetical protein